MIMKMFILSCYLHWIVFACICLASLHNAAGTTTPLCISSYDVIMKMPVGEKIYANQGDISLEFEERMVLHTNCEPTLSIDGLPSKVSLVKKFDDMPLASSISLTTSMGKTTWNKMDSAGMSNAMKIEIDILSNEWKSSKATGVRLTIKWELLKAMSWTPVVESMKSKLSWRNIVYLPQLGSSFEDILSVLPMYKDTSLSVTMVTPRTRPRLSPRMEGSIIYQVLSAAPKRIANLTYSDNHGYGAWDVHSYETHIELKEYETLFKSKDEQTDGVTIAINATFSLTKSKSDAFSASMDVPFECEEALENQQYISFWKWLLGYAGYLLITRFVSGIDAVLGQTKDLILRGFLWLCKAAYSLLILAICIYLYLDVRTPSCIAVYGEEGFRWGYYLMWTLFPSIGFLFVAWPLYLSSIVAADIDKYVEPMLAIHRGGPTKSQARAEISQLMISAFGPCMYGSILILAFRLFVTDMNVISFQTSVVFWAALCFPLWVSRSLWKPDTRLISNKMLAVTILVPPLLALLWTLAF